MALVSEAGIETQESVLQPWEANPYRLTSWLEMLEFSARMFFWCGSILEEIKADCLVGSIDLPGDEPIFALPRELDDGATNKALRKLEHVEVEFQKIGLRISAQLVRNVLDALKDTSKKRHNFQWLMDQIETIWKVTLEETKGKAFFYVPAERAKFFPTEKNQHIFGEAVAKAFPSATYDIAEAGICLALARGSACVFHLMRVLEIGLTALGAKFGVSLAHTNWAPAIEEIERKIREMHKDPTWKALPDCKQQQEFYAQAASHFAILKDAWRNYTMHVRGFYTEEQAERIFENVKGFMQKLAERLSE